MAWENFIALVVVGLACGFVDSSLGMEHGVTSITGILLNYNW